MRDDSAEAPRFGSGHIGRDDDTEVDLICGDQIYFGLDGVVHSVKGRHLLTFYPSRRLLG